MTAKGLKIEACGMGFNNSGYPGAFTPVVISIIKSLVSGNTLHLFSGTSMIGSVRVDIEHPNATIHCTVEEFIAQDTRNWDWVVLDPPYQITRTDAKLNGYGIKGAVSSCVQKRRPLIGWLRQHAENVIWLDQCAPVIKGFKREKIWLLLPGGFHTVRVLTWLSRNQKEMPLDTQYVIPSQRNQQQAIGV